MSAILRSMLSISAATVLSRATGFLRMMVFAAVFGTTIIAQAYTVSSLLPSLIYELFLGGIFYSIFIPILVDRMTHHGEEDARKLTNALLTVALPLLAVVSVVGIVFAETIIRLATDWSAAETLSPEETQRMLDLAVLLFRIFILQMLFYGITTIGTGVLQAHRRFFLPTFAPVLNNLIVVASFVAYELLDDRNQTLAIYVLAIGASLGVAVMALALVPTMWRLGYKPRPEFGHPALAHAARLAGPMLVLVAASVGLQFVANYFATAFNAATELGLAFVVFSLPYGIFVVAVVTALVPELSEQYSRGNTEGYRDTFSFGLRLVVFVVIPSTIWMVVLAEPIVGLLYERGEFDPRDTRTVATLLAAYAVGLLGYGIYFFLVRSFYSRQNTMTPALLNLSLFVFYTASVYLLVQTTTVGVVGVVLALSGTYTLLALVGLAAMRRAIKRIGGRKLLLSLAKILLAGSAMYAVAWTGAWLVVTGPGAGGRFVGFSGVGRPSRGAGVGGGVLRY
ncbi:MAG: murein biosynthesis integral membrane protein MurJ, partial [Rubrobacteraceae bacterium]